MANIKKDVKTNPAGEKDKFSIVGTDINNIIEKERFEMKAAEKGVCVEVLSTELTENMSIKAYEDTVVDFENRRQQPQFNEKLISFEERKQQIEAKKKTISIEEHKKKKQNNDERDIG